MSKNTGTKTNGAPHPTVLKALRLAEDRGVTLDEVVRDRAPETTFTHEDAEELEAISAHLRALEEASVADGLDKYDVWRIAHDLDARLRRVIDGSTVRNPKDGAS